MDKLKQKREREQLYGHILKKESEDQFLLMFKELPQLKFVLCLCTLLAMVYYNSEYNPLVVIMASKVIMSYLIAFTKMKNSEVPICIYLISIAHQLFNFGEYSNIDSMYMFELAIDIAAFGLFILGCLLFAFMDHQSTDLKLERNGRNKSCCVCQQKVDENEYIYKLKCGHVLSLHDSPTHPHNDCIRTWFEGRHRCEKD